VKVFSKKYGQDMKRCFEQISIKFGVFY